MNNIKYTFLLLIFSCFSFLLQAQQAIDILQNDVLFKHTQIGFSLIDISNGKEIQASNSRQFFYPASVQKLLTTNLGLLLCGKDFQFETPIFTSGLIENGVLNGNVIIDASGDPTLNSKRFSNDFLTALITKLKNKKINSIFGQILLQNDENALTIPQTWLYEDVANYYAAMPQLFNYKDNSYTINFTSGADNTTPKAASISPKVPYSFSYILKSSSTIKGDQAYILGTPFSTKKEVIGTIPALKERFSIKGANAHPLYSFIEDVNEQIPVAGNEIKTENTTLLLTHKSVKITEIAKQCNFYSDNFLAESILNQIGIAGKRQYNTADGINAIMNFINLSKLNQEELIVKDGSGLSRLNAMTPHFMSDFLCTFYPHKDFVNTIPVAGESGTMKKFSDTTIKGKIIAKSGSATGVINYAGYVEAKNGKTYAFSLFLNHIYEEKYVVDQKIARFFEALVNVSE